MAIRITKEQVEKAKVAEEKLRSDPDMARLLEEEGMSKTENHDVENKKEKNDREA